jgi:hypothetical protein
MRWGKQRRKGDKGNQGKSKGWFMPEVSRFFGIIITFNFNDHPPPHFHVRYGGQKAIVAIQPLMLLEGRLAPRVLGLVMEWAMQHQAELLENWKLARAQTSLRDIRPLE